MAESLKLLARDSDGRLLILLQCSRRNPGLQTHAFVVDPKVEPVGADGMVGVNWINDGLVLTERVFPPSESSRASVFEVVGPPWVRGTPVTGIEPMRSVTPGDDGTKLAGILPSPAGTGPIAVFQLLGASVVSRSLVQLSRELQAAMLGFVILDKHSPRVTFSQMVLDVIRLTTAPMRWCYTTWPPRSWLRASRSRWMDSS